MHSCFSLNNSSSRVQDTVCASREIHGEEPATELNSLLLLLNGIVFDWKGPPGRRQDGNKEKVRVSLRHYCDTACPSHIPRKVGAELGKVWSIHTTTCFGILCKHRSAPCMVKSTQFVSCLLKVFVPMYTAHCKITPMFVLHLWVRGGNKGRGITGGTHISWNCSGGPRQEKIIQEPGEKGGERLPNKSGWCISKHNELRGSFTLKCDRYQITLLAWHVFYATGRRDEGCGDIKKFLEWDFGICKMGWLNGIRMCVPTLRSR